MIPSIVALFVAVAGVTAHGVHHQARAPINLAVRASSGGWSLQTNSCPSNTNKCTNGCCPSGTTCHDPGTDQVSVCCPDSNNCQGQFQAAPVCADSSWNLFKGLDGNPFCCLPGKIGEYHYEDGVAGTCVDSDTNVPQSASAQQIATGSGGSSPSTSAASSSASSSSKAASSSSSSSSASASSSSAASSSASSSASAASTSAAASSSSASKSSSSKSSKSSSSKSASSTSHVPTNPASGGAHNKTSSNSTSNSTSSASGSKSTSGTSSAYSQVLGTTVFGVVLAAVMAATLL